MGGFLLYERYLNNLTKSIALGSARYQYEALRYFLSKEQTIWDVYFIVEMVVPAVFGGGWSYLIETRFMNDEVDVTY